MNANHTTTITRASVDALFSHLVATEQTLFGCLARDGQAMGRVLPILRKEAAAGRLGQWLPAVEPAHHQDFLAALEDAFSGGGAASARATLQAARNLRITREALIELASGPCSEAVLRAVNVSLEVRNQIIEANLGLAQHCANRVLRGGGASAEDGLMDNAVQEAMLSIQSSVDRFQPMLGFAFSTFAMRGVESSVREARAEWHGNVRLSEGAQGILKKILEAESRLMQRNLAMPSLSQIAEDLGVETFEVERVLRASGLEMRLDQDEQEEEKQPYCGPEVSVGSEAEGIAEMRLEELRRAVRAAMATLSIRQAQVLCLRLGLEDGQERSRPEVARALGLTAPRVRGLEDQGLERLKPLLARFAPEEDTACA